MVLKEDVQGLGVKGVLTDVPNGYFRNFLKPQNLAALATQGLLECVPLYMNPSNLHAGHEASLTMLSWLTLSLLHSNIEKDKQRSEQAAKDLKAKAKAMAVALQTIGKFVIKKKVGDNNKIFGR